MNPLAVVFIAFSAVVGAILGNVLVGLAVGLGVVLVASFTE